MGREKVDSFQERQKTELARTESLAQCSVMLFMLGMFIMFGLYMMKSRVGHIMVYLTDERAYDYVEELVNLGYGFKEKAKDGRSTLQALMKSDFLRSTQARRTIVKLIDGGAALNDKFQGKTPIFYAIRAYDLELIKKFIKAGADTKVLDEEGRTLLFSIANYRWGLRRHVGSRKVFEDKQAELINLLVKSGIDINARDKDGFNVLAVAPTADSVRLLIKLGAKKEPHNGLSPLHGCRFKEALIELIDLGLDPNQQDVNGQTALHRRVIEKEDKLFSKPSLLVSTLLRKGARADIRDKSGKTALHIAIENGIEKCARQLLSTSKLSNSDLKEIATKHKDLSQALGLNAELQKVEKLERSMKKLQEPFTERVKIQQEIQAKQLADYLATSKTQREDFLTIKAGEETIELAFIPAGSYEMGRNKLAVAINDPFLMSKTEITLAQWLAVMEANPTNHNNLGWPITKVSYQQMTDFCNRLARANKRVVRLPSEAEWEYACRAGSKGLYSFSDEEKPKGEAFKKMQELFTNGSHSSLLDVASKKANAWGLHDMNGNAAELCMDNYRGSIPKNVSNGQAYRFPGTVNAAFAQSVRRGGSYRTRLHQCSTTHRDSLRRNRVKDDTGFRIVLPLLIAKKKIEKAPHQAGEEMTNGLGMKLRWIPAGAFFMGSFDDSNKEEEPVRLVRFSRGFWMGAHEVTQSQWKAITGRVRAKAKGDDLPVTELLWAEARNYCNSLTKREQAKGTLGKDLAYRLPSEAEWEYACRARTKGQSYGPIEKIAWIVQPDSGALQPIGKKEANEWGIHDMLGNAAEWCYDRYHSTYAGAPTDGTPWLAGRSRLRVVRGSLDKDSPRHYRASHRTGRMSHMRHRIIGFRVVLDKK